MKIIHVLFICTAVSIATLSALVLMAAATIYSRDFYYTHDFEHYPLGGDLRVNEDCSAQIVQ